MTTHQTTKISNEGGLWIRGRWLLPPLIFLLIWFGVPTLPPSAPFSWLIREQAAWILSRGSGIIGYFLLTLSTVWGLILSSKLVKKKVPPAAALTLHNYLSWTAIGLSVFHAAVLLLDNYYRFTIINLLIPFTGPYSPFWVGLGVASLYIMVITSLSWYWRTQIGQKTWRRLHYVTYLAYFFTTGHGMMAGTDTNQLSIMYATSGFVILFLTFNRMLTSLWKTDK